MAPQARRFLLLALVVVYFAQTWMVYADPAGRQGPPLDALASRGQALWHQHNCQSCHQLYGFGGFLGPDLTNAVGRLTAARLETILTGGSERMPAFRFEADERDALAAFLAAVDRTGVGQVRVPEVVAPRDLLSQLVEATAEPGDDLTAVERRGRDILYEQNCIDCHLPNAASAFGAADLTGITARLDRAALATVLANGVPGKAMPRFAMPADAVDAVHAILERLRRQGEPVRAGFDRAAQATGEALLDLPWFEY